MQNKKSSIFKKIEKAANIFCISIFAFTFILLLANTFITKNANLKNAILIEGHFKNIEKFKVQNKFSYSYNIYIFEKQGFYKILPDYVDCFQFENFLNNVKVGTPLKIYINENNGLKFPVKSIISIRANDKEYINIDCINNQIENDKIYIPLMLLGLLIFLVLVNYKKIIKTVHNSGFVQARFGE